MYHGFADFCGSLAAVSHGHEAMLDVMNVYEVALGRRERRTITLRPAQAGAAPSNNEYLDSSVKG
jgi:hypothetical protein